MARKKKAKSVTVKVASLANVQTAAVIGRGWVKAKIVSAEVGEGDKAPYIKWGFEIIEGKFKGKQPKPAITTLSENALFGIKALLEAVGYKIPKKGFNLDPNELVGEELYIYIDHETYEGRTQNVVTQYSSELPGDDDAEDDEDEDGDDDDDADEDEDGDDDDDADEDEDDDDDDEVTADEIKEMTTQELKDLCEENDLTVDFKKNKTLANQRKAVLKAAKAEGLV